jgi:hypothetical protein
VNIGKPLRVLIPRDEDAIEKERQHWWPYIGSSGFTHVYGITHDSNGRTVYFFTKKRARLGQGEDQK